jgi:hypothetical protein
VRLCRRPGLSARRRAQKTIPALVLLFVLVSCTPKKEEAAKNNTPLPDLGISIVLPEGMEAIGPEDLQTLQTRAAEYPPIQPFRDYPCYQFIDPLSQTALTVSELNFENQADASRDPVDLMEEYRKNLEIYYQVDSIAARELIQGKFRMLIMNFLYEAEGEEFYLIKVLYYQFPRLYFMFDLYLDAQKTSQELVRDYEKMFQSVTAGT